MRHQSRLVAMLGLGLTFGFTAAFNAPRAYSQSKSAIDASQVAFTTPNLLDNGDFDLGTSNWTTSGSGLKWKVEKEQAIFDLNPIAGAPSSQLSFSQLTKKPVRQGKTLALRFQAQGRGRLSVVIYETGGERRTLLARRLTATKVNEPETFTVALKTSTAYYPGQIGLRFNLGFDQTVLGLSHIRLVDLGDTPFDGLCITPDETKLPELIPTKTTTEAPKVVAQPVEVKTNATITPQEPLTLSTGTNLIHNGDFSEQDKYWRAFGDERVDAALENKILKLRLMPVRGEDPSLARFEQEIDSPLTKGQKFTVRFKASGNAKFAVKFQGNAADANPMLVREERAKDATTEYFYQCEANRDYAANDTKLIFILGYSAADVSFSDIQVLTPKL